MRTIHHCLPSLLALLGLVGMLGCEDLPEDDPGANELVTLIAMLEPGDSGMQGVTVTRPVPLSSPVNDTTAFLPGATIVLTKLQDGVTIELDEDAAIHRYFFDRADFPLAAGDSIELRLSGSWNGHAYSGEAVTRIVSLDGLAFSQKPNDSSHNFDADTLMLHDETVEEGLENVTAFYVNWDQSSGDGQIYQYQVETLAVVYDSLSGVWVRTPKSRLRWLRDLKEMAWQVGPYPDLRFPPGRRDTVDPMPVSWGFFVFIDELDPWPSNPERRMGYYQVTLRRLDDSLSRFFFSTHWWIREQPTDPVEFNLQGPHCQGVVGSCAKTSFRVAIVEDAD